MFRVITAAVLALGVVGASAAAAMASTPPDSTVPDSVPTVEAPESPDTSDATAILEPAGSEAAGGEAVVVVDESGTEVAALTLTSFEQGWTGAAEGWEPSAGREYVRATVLVESRTPRGLFEIAAGDFMLQDADGFVATSSAVPTPEEEAADSDPMTSGSLLEGETLELVLTFEVVSGVPSTAVFYSPSYDRLVTVDDLADAG